MKNVVISADGSLVGARIDGDTAAIIANDKEIAMYVDDKYLEGETTLPHISKLALAMLFINELSRHANWHARGLLVIQSLKNEREKK